MRRLASLLTLLGVGLVSLLAARPVRAFPPLPSSFYGTVRLNGANVPDGTLVQASINGKLVYETQTQTYQGDSVYSLDIPGDDSTTLVVEGGQDGNSITFTLGGILADQTAVWKSGTLVELNLSASSVATLVPAQATFTPFPTQTEISLVTATLTPLPTQPAQASPVKAVPPPGSSLPALEVSPTLAKPVATSLGKDPAVSSTTSLYTRIVVAGFILFIVLFIILWLIRMRRPKVEKP
jgi:hypothetical protein